MLHIGLGYLGAGWGAGMIMLGAAAGIARLSAAESPCASLQMKDPVDPATAATNDTTTNQMTLFGCRRSKEIRAVR